MTPRLSRRDFLAKLGFANRPCSDEPAAAWVAIGTLSAYPPGSVTELAQHGVVVSSFPEGIQVVDHANQVKPLRLESNGTLAFCPAQSWPEGSILSIMSGDRMRKEEA